MDEEPVKLKVRSRKPKPASTSLFEWALALEQEREEELEPVIAGRLGVVPTRGAAIQWLPLLVHVCGLSSCPGSSPLFPALRHEPVDERTFVLYHPPSQGFPPDHAAKEPP